MVERLPYRLDRTSDLDLLIRMATRDAISENGLQALAPHAPLFSTAELPALYTCTCMCKEYHHSLWSASLLYVLTSAALYM